jgi:hypothetical protein
MIDHLGNPAWNISEPSGFGPILPIGDVRFDGEFRTDRRPVLFTPSFVEIDPKRSWSEQQQRGLTA